jgi:hypothetical protein
MYRTVFLAGVLVLACECMAQSQPAHSAITDLALIAGAYDCAPASQAGPFAKLILFSDGGWLQRGFLDSMPHKVSWIDVHGRWGKSRVAMVQPPHGMFQVQRDTVFLYTMEPGYPGFGKPSLFDKKVPEASLVLAKRFRILPASGEWIEVVPSNSSRRPIKCKASATI